MPGKYSHSVVLADYSSRGIISLPPDQHSKYVNSTPLTHKTSISQLRLRGTRSAQAVYRDSPGKSPGRQPTSKPQHSTLSGESPRTKERLKIVPDEDAANTFQPMRYSRYYEQMPKSSPAIGLGAQNSQPELRTAYQRQQQIEANLKSLPPNPRVVARGQQEYATHEQRLAQAVGREPNSNLGTGKAAERAGRLPDPASSKMKNVSGPPAHASRQPPTHEKRSMLPGPGTGKDVTPSALPEDRSKAPSTSVGNRSYAGRDVQTSPEAKVKQSASLDQREPQRTDSHGSKHTQIWSPKSPVDSEPNFDGFSDVEPVPSDYFDMHKAPVIHSRSSSLNSTLPIQRPESSDRPASRGHQSSTTPVAFNRTAPVQNGDRNSPSRTTGSSAHTSTRGHRTESSVSSVSMSNGYTHFGVNKHSLESPRKPDQPWRLPEIKEDNGFSPSIFEDREGDDDQMRRDEIESALSGLTIGQISSGKDVTFDNSDAASELSAALPPPITRFRDEEDEFNANMAKLFGEGGDSAITKKGSHTIGRSATKKTKGFFSKFRSRSQALDR